MLKLTLPHKKYLKTVKEGIKDYKNNPSKFDLRSVKKMMEIVDRDFDEYIEYTEQNRIGANLPEGYVPETNLWLLNNDKYIGSYNIRHYLTDGLRQIGGHIAYEIIPSERRKGYLKQGLHLVLDYCRDILSIRQVLLTCAVDNEASYRAMTSVMKERGGYEDSPFISENEKQHRVWIDTA